MVLSESSETEKHQSLYILRRACERYQLEVNLEIVHAPLFNSNDLKNHLLDLGRNNIFSWIKQSVVEVADVAPKADPSMSYLVETRAKPRHLRDYIMSFDADSLKR